MKKGFTLVEILIVVVVFSLIVQAIFAVFNIGRDTFFSSTGCLQLQQGLRLAMDGMTREIRQSTASDISITSGGSGIDFKVPIDITSTPITKSDTISYNLNSNQIIREHPAGTQKVIANDISALSFSKSGSQIAIDITASKTIKQRTYTLDLKEKVQLRN